MHGTTQPGHGKATVTAEISTMRLDMGDMQDTWGLGG